MQRRERILAIAVGVLAGAWLLDGAVLVPIGRWFDSVRADTVRAEEEAAAGQALVDRQARILADWRARHAAGLLDDEAAARFRMQRAIATAAQESGLAIDSVGGGQLIPAGRDETCDSLRLTIAGQGTLAQALAFLASLEGAAQPLRLERSELAALDARRDLVELSLGLSTRLVPATARATRAVPAGTAAWTPTEADPAARTAVVAAKPFLTDRRSAPERPASTVVEAPPPATPAGTWALVGIVARPDGRWAFLRHLGDGRELVLGAGGTFDAARITAIADGAMTIADAEGERTVALGCDLAGAPVPGGAAVRRPATASTPTTSGRPATPAASPFAVPAPVQDPQREAILERLRQQRNRSP